MLVYACALDPPARLQDTRICSIPPTPPECHERNCRNGGDGCDPSQCEPYQVRGLAVALRRSGLHHRRQGWSGQRSSRRQRCRCWSGFRCRFGCGRWRGRGCCSGRRKRRWGWLGCGGWHWCGRRGGCWCRRRTDPDGIGTPGYPFRLVDVLQHPRELMAAFLLRRCHGVRDPVLAQQDEAEGLSRHRHRRLRQFRTGVLEPRRQSLHYLPEGPVTCGSYRHPQLPSRSHPLG